MSWPMRDGPLRLKARTTGPLAIGTHPGQGQIEAVFPSVFYVNVQDNLTAICPKTIAPGPISLILDCAAVDWQKLGLMVGKKCHIQNNLLNIPGQLVIELATAKTWAPPTITAPLTPPNLPPNTTPPREGYGTCALPRAPLPQEVADLAHWLGEPHGTPPTALLGRGPGLTPSGDDLLGGTMIALHALDRQDTANRLWQHLEPVTRSHTNPISRALLSAAAKGMGSARLHHAMNAYFTGKNLDTALAGLDTIGHSSGWDAFAGVVLATRAVMAAQKTAA